MQPSTSWRAMAMSEGWAKALEARATMPPVKQLRCWPLDWGVTLGFPSLVPLKRVERALPEMRMLALSGVRGRKKMCSLIGGRAASYISRYWGVRPPRRRCCLGRYS